MQIVVGTAGHIDHGKTALVKALTGTDTDRLAEEKARGMTIDLGFAYLDQSITIIDVPGHEKFIRNMVAGVSTIHIALLVIAADDGIMPQTKEHLHILKLLGVKQGIIALTKTDLADDHDWIDLVELEIQDLVADTFLKDAPIVRTSIETGEGTETLKQAILTQSKNIETELDRGFFHLPVDRVFSKKGFGSVVTGTVLSGKTKIGSDLEIIPGNQKAKVRGIQTHGTETSSVKMGDRAAINLAGTDLNELYRGTVIVDPYWVNSTKKLIAHVTLIEDTRWKLKNRQRVHLHLGTAEVVARAVMQDPLEAGQSGNALFYLEKPIAALMDERFIIRSLSPMETIGGCLGNWARHFQTTESQVKNWIKSEEIKNEKGFLFTSEKRDESMEYIREVLTQFHKENPYKKSLSQDRLKDATHFSTNWLSYILDYMVDELIKLEGGFALKSHSVVLSDSDASLAKILEDSVKQAGYAILNAKELSSENPKITLEILYILKGEGKIIEVGRGLWIHGDVLDKLKDDLCLFFTANPQLNVSDFKTITNTTRKSAIPLLEYSDKHGLTERVGNSRIKGENCG